MTDACIGVEITVAEDVFEALGKPEPSFSSGVWSLRCLDNELWSFSSSTLFHYSTAGWREEARVPSVFSLVFSFFSAKCLQMFLCNKSGDILEQSSLSNNEPKVISLGDGSPIVLFESLQKSNNEFLIVSKNGRVKRITKDAIQWKEESIQLGLSVASASCSFSLLAIIAEESGELLTLDLKESNKLRFARFNDRISALSSIAADNDFLWALEKHTGELIYFPETDLSFSTARNVSDSNTQTLVRNLVQNQTLLRELAQLNFAKSTQLKELNASVRSIEQFNGSIELRISASGSILSPFKSQIFLPRISPLSGT